MKIREWKESVIDVNKKLLEYYLHRPKLKFGPKKSFPVVDFLCEKPSTPRQDLIEKFVLENDDLSTMLANVTMALQGNGSVKPPSGGGWYELDSTQQAYYVAPWFATAWKAHWKPDKQ